jgi:predicted anti-sigma-YlaC factor YlaD
MHRAVRDNLENYLRDGKPPDLPREFRSHLEECEECRRDVGDMRDQARMLRHLRAPEDVEPAAGFYARVMVKIEAQRPVSLWNAFLEPVFARRLVLACFVVLIALTGYMVTSGNQTPVTASSPEFIMAVDPHDRKVAGTDLDHDREAVLASLVTYQE